MPRKLSGNDTRQNNSIEKGSIQPSNLGRQENLERHHKAEQRMIEAYRLQNNGQLSVDVSKDGTARDIIDNFMDTYNKRRNQGRRRTFGDSQGNIEYYQKSDARSLTDKNSSLEDTYISSVDGNYPQETHNERITLETRINDYITNPSKDYISYVTDAVDFEVSLFRFRTKAAELQVVCDQLAEERSSEREKDTLLGVKANISDYYWENKYKEITNEKLDILIEDLNRINFLPYQKRDEIIEYYHRGLSHKRLEENESIKDYKILEKGIIELNDAIEAYNSNPLTKKLLLKLPDRETIQETVYCQINPDADDLDLPQNTMHPDEVARQMGIGNTISW